MRDKTHMQQTEKWAEYVKSVPREEWKRKLNPFIDAQIIIARRFYKNLEKTEEGREILARIREEKIKK